MLRTLRFSCKVINSSRWVSFFYKQHIYNQRKDEIGKKLTKAKQHPEPELSIFENY